MVSPMYSLITDKNISYQAFKMLKSTFSNGAQVFQNKLGFQGGSASCDVFWHEKNHIWGVFMTDPPINKNGGRFWICFGDTKPYKKNMLPITLEINPPHEGVNRRLGGAFVNDDRGNIYLCHTGKIGGGRKGIGKGAFLEFCRGVGNISQKIPKNIYISELNAEIFIIGNVCEKGIIASIANFSETVKCFKETKMN